MLQPTQPADILKLAIIKHSVDILIPSSSGLIATTEITDLLNINQQIYTSLLTS